VRERDMNCFVGVDIGTTGIRAGVYDDELTLLASGAGRSFIKKGRYGEIIQDPEEIYRETADAVNSAIQSSKVRLGDIECISFDGQMAGIMGIDKEWRAVTPYDSWLDTRCSDQVDLLSRSARRTIIEKTGNIPSYNHGPKILWWKENVPEVFDRVVRFVQPSGWVAGRLCGLGGEDAFIDWSYLHFSTFADSKNLKWDKELLARFGVPQDKLPRIISPFTVIGKVNKQEAELFGIPEGVSVAAGCGDTISCFLGTGAIEDGIAVDVAGTASALSLTVSELVTDLEGLVFGARSVLQHLFYSMSYINGGGLNLEWYRDVFAPGKSFSALDEEIKRIPPGSEGLIFIPHLEGRGYPNNPDIRGQWRGFTRSHTREHFYRSILEGIAYEYALYKERIASLAGGSSSYIVRGVAGGSKSDVWNQIKADVLGCPYCTINRDDISTLGQAVVAAAAAGCLDDIIGTVKGIVKESRTFYPNKERHGLYQESIAGYKQMLSQYEG
jgi:xylulokinase